MPQHAALRRSAVKQVREVEQHFTAQVSAKPQQAQQRQDRGQQGPGEGTAGW
jgi:hypothetical protein